MCIPKIIDEPLRMLNDEGLVEWEDFEGEEEQESDPEFNFDDFIEYIDPELPVEEPHQQPPQQQQQGSLPPPILEHDVDSIYITALGDVIRMEDLIQGQIVLMTNRLTREAYEEQLGEIMQTYTRSELDVLEAYALLLGLYYEVMGAKN